jgi:membrane protein YdbS with pleckstrin-like domain
VVLLSLVAILISIRLFDVHWGSGQTLVPLAVVLVVAALSYLRAEMRLRSYRLDLTPDAVIFQFGRKRSYVPREHIQLFDTESSILLRIFRLRRCNLHTGGGMVVVSPVPARVAAAIERLIYEQPAVMRADRTDANA